MHPKEVLVGLSVLGVLGLIGAAAVIRSGPTASTLSGNSGASASSSLPGGVTLRQIDGGPHYYAKISRQSSWMDRHILIGGWLEQPTSATDVKYDVAMGNNIYWSLAGTPQGVGCSGSFCRVNYDVIRAGGMHVSAPDVTAESGSETVAYEGADGPDVTFGAGSSGWTPGGTSQSSCIPSGSRCGYSVARFFYTGKPSSYGNPGYPTGKKPITQGFSKGVLFWESDAQAAQFLKYSDTLYADSYWMTDSDLAQPSQGGCALLPVYSKECVGDGHGLGLSYAQRALTANYAFNVTRLRQLEELQQMSKPIVVDVETGCPEPTNSCITPAATTSAAWHALIAGARGVVWFQHNFGGSCKDDWTFYDGSNPQSPMYDCQQSPGVTLHDMVTNVSAFNHEVASLNKVLLSPFAEKYVNTGNADVSVMAKYAGGKFYIFAASGTPAHPPAANMKVTFRLAGGYTGPVKVVDEGRTLHAIDGAFTDTFRNSDSVHIYKIG